MYSIKIVTTDHRGNPWTIRLRGTSQEGRRLFEREKASGSAVSYYLDGKLWMSSEAANEAAPAS